MILGGFWQFWFITAAFCSWQSSPGRCIRWANDCHRQYQVIKDSRNGQMFINVQDFVQNFDRLKFCCHTFLVEAGGADFRRKMRIGLWLKAWSSQNVLEIGAFLHTRRSTACGYILQSTGSTAAGVFVADLALLFWVDVGPFLKMLESEALERAVREGASEELRGLTWFQVTKNWILLEFFLV